MTATKITWTLTATIILASCAAVLTVGCDKPSGLGSGTTVAVTGKTPVIDMPEKPVLESLDPEELAAYKTLPESARKKLQNNDKKLKVYAAQLQVAIEDYNTYAAVRNKISEDAVGVRPLRNR